MSDVAAPILIATISGVFIIFFIVVFVCVFKKNRKKMKEQQKDSDPDERTPIRQGPGMITPDQQKKKTKSEEGDKSDEKGKETDPGGDSTKDEARSNTKRNTLSVKYEADEASLHSSQDGLYQVNTSGAKSQHKSSMPRKPSAVETVSDQHSQKQPAAEQEIDLESDKADKSQVSKKPKADTSNLSDLGESVEDETESPQKKK